MMRNLLLGIAPIPYENVFRTYGSHFNYRERYPSGDAFFTPDYPVEAERKFRDNLVNAYESEGYGNHERYS